MSRKDAERWTRLAVPTLLAAALLSGCMATAGAPGSSGSAAARPHDERTFTINPDQPAFQALPGARAFHGVHAGIHGNAGYRIEVPNNWNGVLVLYAHGYRGTGAALTVSNPALRQHLIANGYAWAASSYSANYYDVRAGLEDTNALALAFSELTGLPAPRKYYITGHSMGGHVTAAAVERETLETARHRVRYAGAVPMCGVLGDVELYSYFLAFNHAAHQLAGFPPREVPLTSHQALLPEIRRALWMNYDENRGAVTAQGERLKGILMNLSGGARPIFEESFPAFTDQLLGYGAIEGTWNGIVTGSILNTSAINYQFDADPEWTPGERAFNESIYRVQGDAAAANPRRADGVRWIPIMRGQFDVPVVTLHTLGDLFVPFSMEQIYARRATKNGSDRWLVQRAIRGPAHCQFTVEEEIAAFDAMVRWETEGVRPAGDNVLDPALVADPRFGCAFTTRTREGLPPCGPE